MLVTFLAMNSQQVVASADEGLAFMVGIAGNTMEVAEITEWISAHLEPLN
jgi:prophage maintenance system killer protein